jgi:hypothetical protein
MERIQRGGIGPEETKAWIKVGEMMDNGEMPPKGAPQPSKSQRSAIRGWVRDYLNAEALANAGDPGPVVLRRLNNAQYTYTVRDLTGLDLSPAKEFPTDSAAGEGFTNTGNSLVMSPALLTKYLDAGKEIAKHAELLPDGFRFSPSVTRSDWTNDVLARIRDLYHRYSDAGGASQVNLQGIIFDTNDGGRLPVERYLKATLEEREVLQLGKKSIAVVAKEQNLNAKYLGILWNALTSNEPSLILDSLRAQWREAKPADANALTRSISAWQRALWKFSSVGHIGRADGPKAWQEPVSPITTRQEIRLKVPLQPGQKDAKLYLITHDVGNGKDGGYAVWQQPRLVAPGRYDLPLRDVRDFTREMSARRNQLFSATARALDAVAEAERSSSNLDVAELAKRHGVDAGSVNAWLDYLGIGTNAPLKLDHFTNKLVNSTTYPFVAGWGIPETPSLVANSSDQHVRIPGNLKPHGVCVHPSPTLAAGVGWQSPVSGAVRISGVVTHAHPECGNGVTWSLELRRGATRRRLANGVSQGGSPVTIPPVESLNVQPGDLVSILIGPRDGNHGCDLTDLEFVIKSLGDNSREWNLTKDVSPNVLAGNPHADTFGNKEVWHFYTEPDKGASAGPVVPAGSLLAKWQSAGTDAEKNQYATALQTLLIQGVPAGMDEKHPDVAMYRQLSSLGGPLFANAWRKLASSNGPASIGSAVGADPVGLDPAQFGKAPDTTPVDPTSLAVKASSIIEVRVPAELLAGAEFVASGTIYGKPGSDTSSQMQITTEKPRAERLEAGVAVVTTEGGMARAQLDKSFDDFRKLFPAALCYTKIVPVDEVVTLTLFYREDEPLRRLMLSDAETKQLDKLWEELHFTSQDAIKLVSAYEQIAEFATQDAPAMVIALKPMRKPIMDRAAAFRQSQVDAEPKQVNALVDFAARAYRRPLATAESTELRGLYSRLRKLELPHEEAFQLTLARVFVAPAFLYRLEKASPGKASASISNWELASRLSYFLWSSQPDATLLDLAKSGKLSKPDALAKQIRRMMGDGRIRRMATEFACQWLHIYDFDTLDEKSEKYFPEFAGLRGDIYEESIRFFTDLFQRDSSVLSVFDANHTFLNERLAKFYNIPGVTGADWRRVDGVRKYGRGGILGLATTLAKQSGASRTSPILRGNWISEVLLGEKLPKPPKGVPVLPEDETATQGLTVRQLVAKHTSDPKCSGCHRKIDPFGFSLEGYDAIGRRRTTDLANRAIDTRAILPDGKKVDGLTGLRDYLSKTKRHIVIRQFCRKLLGYALGRATQLSDEPLLTDIQKKLAKSDYRMSIAFEAIVMSRQFREIQGNHAADRNASISRSD